MKNHCPRAAGRGFTRQTSGGFTRQFSGGFTLTELLVVVGIMAVLAALIFPVFAQAREQARKSLCLSNLRQIGLALSMYVDDHDGFFPNTGDPYLWMGRRWRWPLKLYLAYPAQRDADASQDPNLSVGAGAHILVCPSDPDAQNKWDSTSYGYSAAFYFAPEQINRMRQSDLIQDNPFAPVGQSLTAVAFPSEKAVVAEWLTNHDAVKVGWWDWRGGRNYLFADGRARYLPATSIRPAGDGFPDINLTINGVQGKDL
jgi:prepilin-type N-terminal cleavage/methylation domain-containing protein/prepilin-type processing-associated H-X9-DG protein